MSKTFHTYLKKYQFHPFERLFDKSIRSFIKTEYTERTSTIYAIVETDKVSFVPETFRADTNFCIVGSVKVGSTFHEVRLNMAKTWYDSESDLSLQLRAKFSSVEEFTNYFMSQYQDPKKPNLSSEHLYQQLVNVDLSNTNAEMLRVKCPLVNAMTRGKRAYTELHSFQTLNLLDIDCLGDLEILYLGKSTGSTFERLKKHEKWGPIMASRKQEKSYIVYFFEINDTLLVQENFGRNLFLINGFNELPKDSIVRLCEASLINYYAPKYNDEYVGSNLKEVGLVNKWLKNNGYTELVTEIELDGVMGKLCTKNKPFQVRHEIKVTLS